MTLGRLAGTVMLVAALAAAAVVVTRFFSAAQSDSPAALVEDGAALMTPEQRAAVARYHRRLLDDYDIDYRVVTAKGLTDIDGAAVGLLREFGGDSPSRSGRALLLLIDAGSNRVRLEVGYPLEGVFPDAFVDYVERQQMVPFFERSRVADGIVATTELIVAQASRDTEGLGSAADSATASSGGAGAVSEARLGAGPRPPASAADPEARPGTSPGTTLQAYFQAMEAHDGNPALPIYTPDTRRMLATWLMTPAQMDSVIRTYRRCPAEAPIVSADGARSVIRFPAAARTCAPFFFAREDQVWLLDLVAMQRVIRFGPDNAWHFAPDVDHPYRFAFDDWRLDARGYPKQ